MKQKTQVQNKKRLIIFQRSLDQLIVRHIRASECPEETFSAFVRRAVRNEMRKKGRMRKVNA